MEQAIGLREQNRSHVFVFYFYRCHPHVHFKTVSSLLKLRVSALLRIFIHLRPLVCVLVRHLKSNLQTGAKSTVWIRRFIWLTSDGKLERKYRVISPIFALALWVYTPTASEPLWFVHSSTGAGEISPKIENISSQAGLDNNYPPRNVRNEYRFSDDVFTGARVRRL